MESKAAGVVTDKPKPQKLHLVAIAFLFAIAPTIWLFTGAQGVGEAVRDAIAHSVGKQWQDLPTWILILALSVPVVPVLVCLVLSIALFSKFEAANVSLRSAHDLSQLDKARRALQQGLAAVDKIEREYRTKASRLDQIQSKLEELQALRDVDTQSLQKKLNAIAYASRGRVWMGRIAVYILGILTSLFTSYLWDVISK